MVSPLPVIVIPTVFPLSFPNQVDSSFIHNQNILRDQRYCAKTTGTNKHGQKQFFSKLTSNVFLPLVCEFILLVYF